MLRRRMKIWVRLLLNFDVLVARVQGVGGWFASAASEGQEKPLRVIHHPSQPEQNILAPAWGNILLFEVGSDHAHFLTARSRT